MNNENNGRELDWNETIEDGDLIPAGDYDATIERFERDRSKGEGKLPPCNMAVVYFTVHAGRRDVTVREYYVLHTTMMGKLSELFIGAGLKKRGEDTPMKWQMLPGKKVRVNVGVKSGTNSDRQYNFIKKVYPCETPGFTPGKF